MGISFTLYLLRTSSSDTLLTGCAFFNWLPFDHVPYRLHAFRDFLSILFYGGDGINTFQLGSAPVERLKTVVMPGHKSGTYFLAISRPNGVTQCGIGIAVGIVGECCVQKTATVNFNRGAGPQSYRKIDLALLACDSQRSIDVASKVLRANPANLSFSPYSIEDEGDNSKSALLQFRTSYYATSGMFVIMLNVKY